MDFPSYKASQVEYLYDKLIELWDGEVYQVLNAPDMEDDCCSACTSWRPDIEISDEIHSTMIENLAVHLFDYNYEPTQIYYVEDILENKAGYYVNFVYDENVRLM